MNIMRNLQKLRKPPPKINYSVINSSIDYMAVNYTFSGNWA